MSPTPETRHSHFFIDGRWQEASGGERRPVLDPTTEEVVGEVPEGTAEDVDQAVEAAARAFPGWAATPPAERGAALKRLQRLVLRHRGELAETLTAELGAPQRLALDIQVAVPARVLGAYARHAADFPWQEEVGNSRVLREPAGVAGCITPWNYPLHQAVTKVAAALAAGCTVVLKPSEITPLCIFQFARLVEAAELPPGVFNLVCGDGPTVGEALVRHPRVDLISFTGSTTAGRRVATLAAEQVKRVTLELGGKSANLILDDADLRRAVRTGVKNCFLNSGQTCSAWTRMVVPRQHLEEATALAVEAAQEYPVGDPRNPDTRLGPLVSQRQLQRVRGYIRQGIEEGAVLATGGAEPPVGADGKVLDRGFFVRPTVFTEVDNAMTIAREEIFGPVLAILPHDGDDHAVSIANDSPYGLAGAVWSQDGDRALAVAQRLRTGQVDINGGRYNIEAPFGGTKQSGYGRELGRQGLEEFLHTKSLQL
ncbi:MAG: aldehyde dehydrogenase family protein [Acidobacteriota bacterium]|nr:aldehyde dehydrogenase family protein [Acidobacteriota bacterium]